MEVSSHLHAVHMCTMTSHNMAPDLSFELWHETWWDNAFIVLLCFIYSNVIFISARLPFFCVPPPPLPPQHLIFPPPAPVFPCSHTKLVSQLSSCRQVNKQAYFPSVIPLKGLPAGEENPHSWETIKTFSTPCGCSQKIFFIRLKAGLFFLKLHKSFWRNIPHLYFLAAFTVFEKCGWTKTCDTFLNEAAFSIYRFLIIQSFLCQKWQNYMEQFVQRILIYSIYI